MKKILIIGGTRFFGKRLVEKLIEQQQDITVITRGELPKEFSNTVTHIQCDRMDAQALKAAIAHLEFDIVYDNINYSPQEAMEAVEIFENKTKRYVFTSTLSVHEADGIPKNEKDFDPYTYPILLGNKNNYTYGEGKRQAEAVFFQKATFPVVAVRFPIVMGEDDYTERLLFHIKKIQKNQPISFMNLDANMGFISSEEAAEFLLWIGNETYEGPIQASSYGVISIKELISLIEKITGNKANLLISSNEEYRSPYAIPKSWYMKTTTAQQLGFTFSNLYDWLPILVKNLL